MRIDIYHDPVLYNAINGQKQNDFPFYLFWAEKVRGPVLELACGTGRLANPLLEMGLEYTGLDQSTEYIHWCREHFSCRAHFVRGDMRGFDLKSKFDLILIGFNSFLHLYREAEAMKCLKSVHQHLSDSGRFLVDIFVPDPEFLYRDENKNYDVLTFEHPEGGSCRVKEQTRYDIETEINHIHWYLDRGKEKEIIEYEFDMRMYYPDTMDRLLTEAGFVIQEKWGDYDGQPFDETSPLQLYICSV
ncbi:MAG: class I SAM-dependent methyltransferase [Fidelibacterota bacterium]